VLSGGAADRLSKLKRDLIQCISESPLLSVTEPSRNVVEIEGIVSNYNCVVKKENSVYGINSIRGDEDDISAKVIVNFEPQGSNFSLGANWILPEVTITGKLLPEFTPQWRDTVDHSVIKSGKALLESFVDYITRWTCVNSEIEELKRKGFVFKLSKSTARLLIQCHKADLHVPLPAIYLVVPNVTSSPISYQFGPEFELNPEISFIKQKFEKEALLCNSISPSSASSSPSSPPSPSSPGSPVSSHTLTSLCSAWESAISTLVNSTSISE